MFKAIGWSVMAWGLAAAIAGCGDDEGSTSGAGGGTGTGGSAPQGSLNEATARDSASTSIDGANTAVAGQGIDAARELFPLGALSLGLVQPAGPSPQAALGETGSVKQAVQTGVCDCAGESCTFDACNDSDWGSDLAITGTISWTSGNVVADLHYVGTSSDGVSTYDFGVTMDVQVGTGTIDGTVGTTGAITTQGFGNSWDATIDFNAVSFDAGGCPAAGSIDVTATTKMATVESTASSTITFDGSGC
jgi:hypothetical protein